MRQKRAKIYRKLMQQYQLQFGFREPYQLLLDDTFVLGLTRYRKTEDVVRQFSNVLSTPKLKLMISQCCMVSLYQLGKVGQEAVDLAKTMERRMCNHREAINPAECVKQCIGETNKHRYILASENSTLRRDLRLHVPALPMIHFTQSVIVMEPMSPLTKNRIEENENTKLSLPIAEKELLRKKLPNNVQVDIIGGAVGPASGEGEGSEDEEQADPSSSTAVRKPTRGPKNPNPLSVKKPKQPKLTKEEKLAKEQELKKQKQRLAAAKARANNVNAKHSDEVANGADAGPSSSSTNASDPEKASQSLKKRKRMDQEVDQPTATSSKPSPPSQEDTTQQPPTKAPSPAAAASSTPNIESTHLDPQQQESTDTPKKKRTRRGGTGASAKNKVAALTT